MVVRGEHRLRAELFRVGAVLEHRAGDGHAVVGRGAAADLVEDQQALVRRLLQDGGGLLHLDHEGALAGGEIVRRADAREHAVDDADHRALRRDERAHLRHQHDQRGLAHVGALAGHVRAGDDGDAVGRGVQERVVRHEELVVPRLLHDRVATLADVERAAQVDLGADILVARGDLGERTEHVQLRHGVSGALHARDLLRHHVAHLDEEIIFQLVDLLARVRERALQLFELRGEIPLARYECLLADVVVGQLGLRAVRHVEIVAEDAVVADLQLLHAGRLALALLELCDHLRAVVAHAPQVIHLLAVALAEDAALAQRDRRLVADRALDACRHVLERVERRDRSQRAALDALQLFLQLRQPRRAGAERREIPRVRRAVYRPADQTLDIADLAQREHQLRAQHAVRHELAHRALTLFDLHGAE